MPELTAEIAHYMALGPLAFLGLRRETRTEWWWIACALFGVDFLADSGAHLGSPWFWSAIYPVAQAGIVCAVVETRTTAKVFVGALVAVGIISIITLGLRESTLPLRLFAWGWLCVILWPLPLGKLRVALLMAFGGGLLTWAVFLLWPMQPLWALYQCVRAASIVLFCQAATSKPLQLAAV